MGTGPNQLETLAAATGRAFPNLTEARQQTTERLAKKQPLLGALPHDEAASIVLMGSWGRQELTSGSDDDFMLLVQGAPRTSVTPPIASIKEVLDRAPGKQGVFGDAVFTEKLVNEIGLDEGRQQQSDASDAVHARVDTGDR